ncbi:MAG: flippase [Catenulispora sp.]|nr:flippase [Catenulispora sp.]
MTVDRITPRRIEARRRPCAAEPRLTDPAATTHVNTLTVDAITAYAAEVAPETGSGTGQNPAARKRKEGILASSFWQLTSFLARMSGTFVAGQLIFRFGGGEAAGKFAVAQTVAMITYTFMCWGIPNLLTRTLTREPDQAPVWLESTVFLALACGALWTALFVPVWLLCGGGPDTGTAVALSIMASAFDAVGRLVFSAFWAFDRMRLEALATWIQELTFLVSAVVILELRRGPAIVLVAFWLTRVLGAAVGWYHACRLTRRLLVPRPHGRFLVPLFRGALTFAAGDVGSTLYTRQGWLVLEAVKGTAAVGLYNVGASLVFQLNILARMINNAIFPRMARAWPARPATLCGLRDVAMRAQGVLGVPLAVGGALVSGQLLVFMGGHKAAPAAHCMMVLALVIPVRMLSHTIGTAMTAVNHQRERSTTTMWAVFVNLGASLALVPRFSYDGAASATLITETFLLGVNATQLRGWIGASALSGALATPALATIPMALGLLASQHWPFPARMVLAAVLYTPTLIGVFLWQRSRSTGKAVSISKNSVKASVSGYLKAAS